MAAISDAVRPTVDAADDLLARFERDGFVVIDDALTRSTVGALSDATDRTWARHRDDPMAPGARPLHLLAFLGEDEAFIELLDHPRILPLIVDLLGWNVFVYHCHLDVHPPCVGPGPVTWMWHRDGGVQNHDLGGTGAPRMSVKVAYFLTDVSEPGRGNLVVMRGSHRRDLARPSDDHNDLPGALPVLAQAGSAVLFDRRLWHMRSENRSPRTRKALFYAYTYRWVRARDDMRVPPQRSGVITPVRAQLLGAGTGAIGHWMPGLDDAPLQDRGEDLSAGGRRSPAANG
jgi:ectoine hydroxylase-related dioxygenase (phytanoyl-CoA dioxygenase family)